MKAISKEVLACVLVASSSSTKVFGVWMKFPINLEHLEHVHCRYFVVGNAVRKNVAVNATKLIGSRTLQTLSDLMTSLSSKSAHSETRTQINYPCGPFKQSRNIFIVMIDYNKLLYGRLP